MSKDKCVFCKIVDGEMSPDIIYEDKEVLVILDIDWVTKGHSLVIWKDHHINASDLTKDEYSRFSDVLYRTEKALLDVLQKEKSVVLKTGGLIPHFHFHIYPLDSDTPWQEIKDMFDKKVKYQPKDGETEELLSKLKEKL